MKYLREIPAVLAVSVLAGCGGGSSGGDDQEEGISVGVENGEPVIEVIGNDPVVEPVTAGPAAGVTEVYSFSAPAFTVSCVDGSTAPFPPEINTFFVSVDNNEIISAAPLFLNLGLSDGDEYTGCLLYTSDACRRRG